LFLRAYKLDRFVREKLREKGQIPKGPGKPNYSKSQKNNRKNDKRNCPDSDIEGAVFHIHL